MITCIDTEFVFKFHCFNDRETFETNNFGAPTKLHGKYSGMEVISSYILYRLYEMTEYANFGKAGHATHYCCASNIFIAIKYVQLISLKIIMNS